MGTAENNPQYIHHISRILTGRKETGVFYNMFSNAKPDSTFGQLYSQLSEDDKEIGLKGTINKIKTSEDKLTVLSSDFSVMNDPNNNCDLKFVWFSPQEGYTSLAFPKKSSLYPFFTNLLLKKFETGEWDKIRKFSGPALRKCKSNKVESRGISFSKVVFPFSILIGGALLAIGIFGCELYFFKFLKKTSIEVLKINSSTGTPLRDRGSTAAFAPVL